MGFGGRQRFKEVRLTPIQNAPPKSLRATQGQGSREWSMTNILKRTDAGRMEPREGAVALAGRQGG